MKPSVAAIFPEFSAYHEGPVYSLYSDSIGKVTWGIGELCDPVERAYGKPLRKQDGTIASKAEIEADFASIKANLKEAMAKGHKYAYTITALRSNKQDIIESLQKRLAQNDVALTNRFPEFQEWPADAQLAIHSLSWAAGTGFMFPKLETYLKAQDFLSASKEVVLKGGYEKRNADNVALLESAAKAKAGELDPDKINASVHTFAVSSWPSPPAPGVTSGGSLSISDKPSTVGGIGAGILGAILLWLWSRGKR